MGRADLSRHRGSHPSESRQTVFHGRIQRVLQDLTQSSNENLSEAASSLLNASTQRQQQTAIKALCATLSNSRHPAVGTVLGEIMLLPRATMGIVSTTLRGCLRVSIPEQVQSQFDQLYARLGKMESFPSAVADMRLAACLLSEHESRSFILGHDVRIKNIISHICQLLDIYLKSSLGDSGDMYDAQLLPDACDSAMKAAQDTLNFLHTSREGIYNVDDIVTACQQVLGIEFVPRSCALACGVAYVTGRAYCASARTTNEVVDVTTDILQHMQQFSPFSRLSLLRALMEAPATRPALAIILFPSDEYPHSVFASLASIITANADVHLRFLAMDTLIACIRRAKPLSTPCRDVVLDLVYERWQEPFPGVTSQMRETMEALVATDRGEEDTAFWTALAERFASGDWTVKGMHAPLGVLVKRIGAKRMLLAKEDCQQLAFAAVAADYRLVKHAVDWLGSFWKILRKEVSFEEFLDLTGRSLIEVLVDLSNRTLRERIAEQALPEYFRSVGKDEIENCANALLKGLGNLQMSDQEALARGTVSILSVARKNGVFVASFTDPKVYQLLQAALACAEEDVRSNALDLIVTSRVPTEPVSEQELNLVLGCMTGALTPGGSLADRSRFRHCMRRMFERLAACRHSAKDGSSGWWMRIRKEKYGGVRTKEFEEQRCSLLRRISRFESDVLGVLISSCYPGAAFARRSSALELLELQFKNLGCRVLERSAQESFLAGVIVCLTDEWERPRRASLQVLSSLQALVPIIGDRVETLKLQKHALSLLCSPKQKEVDSGVSLLRAMFRKYVLYDQTNVLPEQVSVYLRPFDCVDDHDNTLQEESTLRAAYNGCQSHNVALRGLEYIKNTLRSIKGVLHLARSDMNGACKRGLFHGHFLLLRCVFQDIPWERLPVDGFRDTITSCIDEIIDVSWKCTQIAMKGVSFKAFETFRLEGENLDEDPFVGDDAPDVLLKETYQLESSACFHSLKELCIAIGVLSHQVPIGEANEKDCPRRCVMEETHVLRAGNMFLHIFRNTRHWGVLDGASEGFQLLCESLLRCSSGNLRSLPRVWSCETVHMALSEGLYVLRRSAGVPAVITGIVNAEGNCNRRSYEAPLLHETCATLLVHLESSPMFTDERLLGKDRSREEESVAHALNILRSLFLNSNVATTILRHLEGAAICCLKAFRSASWLIRNSAMMLFSAIVRRGIGACGERKADLATSSFDSIGGTSATVEGERRLRGTTAFQFFSRHPKIRPYLLEILQESIMTRSSRTSEDHAALYPALYLLSCLSPASAEDPSTTISMKPFRAFVRQCSHWRSNYVRRIAAVAYVPILEDPSHVAKAVQEILSDIPSVPQKRARQTEETTQAFPQVLEEDKGIPNSWSGIDGAYIHQNKLHGDLLTLSAILTRTRAVMSLDDAKDTVRVLLDLLPNRTWIATDGRMNPCSYTRAAMVSVMSEAFILAKSVKDREPEDGIMSLEAETLRDICTSLRHQLVDFTEEECGFGAPIAMASLRRKAGDFLLKQSMAISQNSPESFRNALKDHLRQADSTNRDTAIAGIQAGEAVVLVRTQEIDWGSASKEQVRSVLAIFTNFWRCSQEMLQREDDQELVVAALRLHLAILDSVGKIPTANALLISGLQPSDITNLAKWAQRHMCVDVREFSLILMGSIVSHGICSVEAVKEWMYATEAASVSQATTTRIASCKTLEVSGLAKNWKQRPTMHTFVSKGFIVLARLLEDDHVDVREHALRTVQQYTEDSFRSKDTSLNVLPSLTKIYTELGSNSTLCESLFTVLTRRLGKPSSDLSFKQDLLMQAIAASIGHELRANPTELLSPEEMRNADDPRKNPARLFQLEDEIDDGEPVLRLQLVAHSFRDAILAKGKPSKCDFLKDMLLQLLSDLKGELHRLVQTPECPVICGPSFNPDGFLISMKTMLRLFLGMCCIFAADSSKIMGPHLKSASKELREIGHQGRRGLHPVLYNVLDSLCTILTEECSEHGLRSAQGIFFLLTP